MKKVLIISSSPRKGGNSDMLCARFAQGARESGHRVEKVFLREKFIPYCTGCGYCFTSHKCSLKDDDMSLLLDAMLAADVIVLATPVYFYNMSAQLKAFIDRCAPCYREMYNKEFYYILTSTDDDKKHIERAVDAIRSFTLDCLPGAVERGIVYGVGVSKVGQVKDSSAWQEAYKLGKTI
ncbi:MAG: flavodoxin family protein [Oscillospiraceae bacterium]|nr:flavodoxin family protein [Oscillospiraceae bacterium]